MPGTCHLWSTPVSLNTRIERPKLWQFGDISRWPVWPPSLQESGIHWLPPSGYSHGGLFPGAEEPFSQTPVAVTNGSPVPVPTALVSTSRSSVPSTERMSHAHCSQKSGFQCGRPQLGTKDSTITFPGRLRGSNRLWPTRVTSAAFHFPSSLRQGGGEVDLLACLCPTLSPNSDFLDLFKLFVLRYNWQIKGPMLVL